MLIKRKNTEITEIEGLQSAMKWELIADVLKHWASENGPANVHEEIYIDKEFWTAAGREDGIASVQQEVADVLSEILDDLKFFNGEPVDGTKIMSNVKTEHTEDDEVLFTLTVEQMRD